MSAASAGQTPEGDVDEPPYLERGSRAYWRASLALLFAGYATFSLLYCVQPLLPEFTKAFGGSQRAGGVGQHGRPGDRDLHRGIRL